MLGSCRRAPGGSVGCRRPSRPRRSACRLRDGDARRLRQHRHRCADDAGFERFVLVGHSLGGVTDHRVPGDWRTSGASRRLMRPGWNADCEPDGKGEPRAIPTHSRDVVRRLRRVDRPGRDSPPQPQEGLGSVPFTLAERPERVALARDMRRRSMSPVTGRSERPRAGWAPTSWSCREPLAVLSRPTALGDDPAVSKTDGRAITLERGRRRVVQAAHLVMVTTPRELSDDYQRRGCRPLTWPFAGSWLSNPESANGEDDDVPSGQHPTVCGRPYFSRLGFRCGDRCQPVGGREMGEQRAVRLAERLDLKQQYGYSVAVVTPTCNRFGRQSAGRIRSHGS